MKKTIIILVTLLLALLLCSQARASVLQKSIVPASSGWVLHFDMEKFTATSLYEQIVNDECTQSIRKKQAQFSKIFKIDFFKDITGITIYGAGEKKDAVVCFTGNFDKAHLLGLLELEESYQKLPYGEFIIHDWERSKFGVFANDHLVLLAENEEAIKTGLDVIAGKKENITSSALKPYLEKIPPDAFLVGLVDNISSLAKKRAKPVILKKIDRALFTAMEAKEKMALELNFSTESPQDAERMEQIIKGLIAMADMHLEETESKSMLPEDMKVSVEGNKVLIGLIYPVQDLVDILSKRKRLPRFLPLGGF
jgi:hypothetical protein